MADIKLLRLTTGEDIVAEVTNQEYEAAIQEKKREIRILKPEYLGQFRTEFETLIEK